MRDFLDWHAILNDKSDTGQVVLWPGPASSVSPQVDLIHRELVASIGSMNLLLA